MRCAVPQAIKQYLNTGKMSAFVVHLPNKRSLKRKV